MCSTFSPIMDNYQGDLTDILRGSGTGAYGSCGTGTSSSEAAPLSHDHHWHFSSDLMMNFSSVSDYPRGNDFGDPFSNMRDPFLHELDMPAGSTYFNTASSAEIIGSGGLVLEEAACFSGALIGNSDIASVLAQKMIVEDDMRRPLNGILSNMIQISPSPNAKLPVSPCDSPVMVASPRVTKPSAVVSCSMINAHTSKDCLVDNTGVQISSPRNPGLKRSRKSQAKKSICIPAPAAANSRQSGEVVPSDLWAWRKYGQKPIKGSPYPRGYYRCSSSKGCPARKQVERSRTDPNMLVITYTSEHNHPWPTQRNALAGSSRSQPFKNNAASKNISETTQPQEGTTRPKEEQQEISNSDSSFSPVVAAGNSANSASVKEEIDDIEKKQLEMDDWVFSDGFPYKSEDLFAELGEIEADSLNLLFTHQGFNTADVVHRESKALDPLHFFDWSGDNSTNKATSFEEPRRRLL